jgi:hypothetical protein
MGSNEDRVNRRKQDRRAIVAEVRATVARLERDGLSDEYRGADADAVAAKAGRLLFEAVEFRDGVVESLWETVPVYEIDSDDLDALADRVPDRLRGAGRGPIPPSEEGERLVDASGTSYLRRKLNTPQPFEDRDSE